MLSIFPCPRSFRCSESYCAAERTLSGGKIGFVFGVLASEGDPCSHSTSNIGTGASANGTDRHQDRNRMAQEDVDRVSLLERKSLGLYTFQWTTQNSIDETLHEHSLTPQSLGLSAAYADDLPTAVAVTKRMSQFTSRFGGTLGYVSVAIFRRLTFLNRHINQFAISLTPNGCSVKRLTNRKGLSRLRPGL